jgi:multiple sugar transport system permease protein
MKKQKDYTFALLVGPPFFILVLLTIVPLFFTLGTSFTSWNLVKPGSLQFNGLQNYWKMINDPTFWVVVGNTVYQVVGTVAGQLIIGMICAYILSRPVRGMGALRSVYIIPMMMTPIVVGMMWRMLLNAEFGVVNYILSLFGVIGPNWLGDPTWAMPSVIMTDWWLSTPFVTMIFVAGIQSMPIEPFEAAAIDGANKFQVFTLISLPLLKPMIYLAALFRTMDAIKRFDTIYVLTSGGPGMATETMNLHSYFHAFGYLNLGYSAALSILMMLISFAAASIFLRKL